VGVHFHTISLTSISILVAHEVDGDNKQMNPCKIPSFKSLEIFNSILLIFFKVFFNLWFLYFEFLSMLSVGHCYAKQNLPI